MPEYEYRCKSCEKGFVIERSMADSSPVICTHCNSGDLSRVWGANFLTGKSAATSTASGTKSGTDSQSNMCATNPAKPKNCCPCG